MQLTVLAMGLLLAAACTGGARERPADAPPPGGVMQVRWSGTDTGQMRAPGAAQWCQPGALLQLTAVQGDTGLGLVLYPKEKVVPGQYPIVTPTATDTVVPRAAVAVRWLAPTVLRGFQGFDGVITVRQVGQGRVSGTFRGKLRAMTAQDSLIVAGTFDQVPITPMARECEASQPGQSSDSEID